MVGRDSLTPRRAVVLAILVLVAPTVVAGVSHALGGGDAAVSESGGQSVENLTIVTAQGRSPEVAADPGGIEIVNTTSKERVWSHDDDRCLRYYDAEPVDNSTLLITANCERDTGGRMRLAMEYDWRAETIDRAFRIPWDAHDVDKLGPHRYAVADIADQTAYVYNYTADDTVDWASFRDHPVRNGWRGGYDWEYDFTRHFPESDGGEEGYDGDYTHLNDIDAVGGDEAFLLSPRDFNRVMLVNRSTKEIEWTLGSQDDTSVIHGQHHPALLSRGPATVLVGDSLNHRVVEYRRVTGEDDDSADEDGDGWVRTWTYIGMDVGGLNWPRDVHRLPNGNTLVMDTGNDRVLEVAPNGTTVWTYETMPNPFDVDRYAHGDQPRGPTAVELRAGNATGTPAAGTGGVSVVDRYHRLAGWVLPGWVGKPAFLGLVGAAVLAVGWALTEAGLRVRRRL
jgi:hypothetical protein